MPITGGKEIQIMEQINLFDVLNELNEDKEYLVYSNGRYWKKGENSGRINDFTPYADEADVFKKPLPDLNNFHGLYPGNPVVFVERQKEITKQHLVAFCNKSGEFYHKSGKFVKKITNATWFPKETKPLPETTAVEVRDYILDNSKLILLVYFGIEMHDTPEYKSYVLKELPDRPWLIGTWYGGMNEFTISGNTCNEELEFRWRRRDAKREIFFEKMNKGYFIRRLVSLDEDIEYVVEEEETNVPRKSKVKIVNELIALANGAFRARSNDKIELMTDDILERYQNVINKMTKIKDLDKFNAEVSTLYELILRSVDDIEGAFAKDVNDFDAIIGREQDFLDNILALRETNTVAPKKEETVEDEICDKMGITVETVTDADEIKHIKDMLGPNAHQFWEAYRVVNKRTAEAFDKYVKENGSKVVDLFHGSQTGNWWSIITRGLLIRPANVSTCGSMFGVGIYLADEADKSINYTSMHTYHNWRSGSDDNFGFLGIYRTAQTKSYDLYSWNADHSNLDKEGMKKRGTDFVFAHKSQGMLCRNEFVFYDADQVDIKYLIKIKSN